MSIRDDRAYAQQPDEVRGVLDEIEAVAARGNFEVILHKDDVRISATDIDLYRDFPLCNSAGVPHTAREIRAWAWGFFSGFRAPDAGL